MTKVGKIYRETLTKHIKTGVGDKKSTFLISYTGVSGPQMNSLRKELKGKGANVFVSRNTMAGVALKELKFDQLAQRLGGQTAFVWGDADSVEISKAIIKFAKECKGVTILGGLLEGSLLEKNDIQTLSELPSRKVLISQLLATMQSPIARLAGALNAKTQELMSILSQLSEQKVK